LERIGLRVLALPLLLTLAAAPARAGDAADIPRTNVRSPVIRVAPDDVRFLMDHTGFVPQTNHPNGGTRFFISEINPAALAMISRARRHIVLSVFLFDNLYAAAPGQTDLVRAYTDALLRKKAATPDIDIAVILDASHRAYGHRVSPAEQAFRAHGIDVFYSDLLADLKSGTMLGVREGAGHLNRGVDRLTLGAWSSVLSQVFGRAKLPARFDGDLLSLESVYNIALLKANHRKLLVTDNGAGEYEALVTSANPHNASASHVNTGIWVRGAPARFLYNLLRADLRQSAGLGGVYAHWHDAADRSHRRTFLETHFPPIALDPAGAPSNSAPRTIGVTVATEVEIGAAVLETLARTGPGDEIRIQMFYLSFQPVIDAILAAAGRSGRPVRLLLDANKDSFNREKDGTPNRQVARYLRAEAARRGLPLAIRWYATHGEQNHAKVMSIANPQTGRYALTTGSCNWTGRNIDGINMEANLLLENARDCVAAFNSRFDLLWSNADGCEYSLPYEAFQDQIAEDWKWHLGEQPYYYGVF
jgi:phosphatidylserine/phosphatidylglycerophosphate/cardiolipin synthase-like enzyme